MRSLKLAATLVVVVLLGLGWLWLRDSPLFAVSKVKINGLPAERSAEIGAALDRAARTMTTMDVDTARLRAAVAPLVVVKALTVHTSLLHEMTIDLTAETPVAVLTAGARQVAVAGDGRLLPGAAAARAPTLAVASIPAGRVTGGGFTAMAVDALAAAPPQLLTRVARVTHGALGLIFVLRDGPALVFGDASRPNAKWLAAATVLSDQAARGALYIDLRLPERPAAQVGDPQTTPGELTGTTAAVGVQPQAVPVTVNPAGTTPPALSPSTGG